MILRVDRREGSRQLIRPLRQMGAVCKVCTLPFGDVAFDGWGPDGRLTVGVEVKTLSDFLASLTSGRLAAHQLPGMVKAYDRAYLLIQGVWRPGTSLLGGTPGLLMVPRRSGRRTTWAEAGWGGRRWTYGEVFRALCSITEQAGVRVIRTGNGLETVYALWALADWWDDDWTSHTTLKTFHTRQPPRAQLSRPSAFRTIIAQVPQVGWEYSFEAEEAFGGSVWQAAQAPASAWAAIRRAGKTRDGKLRPKIGLARAKKIVAALRGE